MVLQLHRSQLVALSERRDWPPAPLQRRPSTEGERRAAEAVQHQKPMEPARTVWFPQTIHPTGNLERSRFFSSL